MKLSEAIERGIVSLDEEIDILHWDPDDPESVREPYEHAYQNELKVGETFILWIGIQFKKVRKYKVVHGEDYPDEDDSIDAELEEQGCEVNA